MRISSFATATALSIVLLSPAMAAFTFNTVMVGGRPTSDPAGPGLGAGIDWSIVHRAVINESGQVGLQATLLTQGGVTSATDVGIWRWENDALTLLAREGSQAPGLPTGATIGSLSSALTLQIDDAGTVLFRPSLSGTATASNNLAWTTVAADNTATLVAREGDVAPGLGALSYGDSLNIRSDASGLADSGKVLYQTNLSGPGVNSANDSALWYGEPGNASLLFREGASATDFGPTAVYSTPVITLASAVGDQIAIQMVVRDSVNDTTIASVLRSGLLGSLATVAQSDQSAPGVGGTFQGFSAPRINNAGAVLFNSTTDSTDGVFLKDAGGLHLVTAIGQPAPGTDGTIFLSNDVNGFQTALNKTGDAAFYANLNGSASVDDSNDSGLWVFDDGVTRLAVREGNAAPGLAGVNIGRIEHWAFNDCEDLVFVSRLAGSVTPGVDDFAMWLATADGSLHKVLQMGDGFDVDPTTGNDIRTISSIAINGIAGGGSDHQSNEMALADSGQLLFRLRFTDGTSGVFVANLSVPEPASLTLLGLSAMALLTVRRRHA